MKNVFLATNFFPCGDRILPLLCCSLMSTVKSSQLFPLKLIARTGNISQSEINHKYSWLCESTPCVLQHDVPLTAPLWTLSASCLTWPPPNVSLRTARSWPSRCPHGDGWVMCVLVGGLCGMRGLWKQPLFFLLGPGSFESCWLVLDTTQRELAGLEQTVLAGVWPLADTKLVWGAVCPHKAGHALPLLTRLARYTLFFFFMYWEVFFHLWLPHILIISACWTSRFFFWLDGSSTKWAILNSAVLLHKTNNFKKVAI